jgi:hypothetical protein
MAEHQSEAGAPPDFLGESMDEVRLFFGAFVRFTLHPIRFSEEWSQGRTRTMNPVGFFGTAIGLQLAAVAVVTHFKPDEVQEALRELMPRWFWPRELLASQLPLLRAALFAMIVHAWLSRRSHQPFRASLGVILYASGWVALCRAALAPFALFPSTTPLRIAMGIVAVANLLAVALALGGVHRLRRWTAALAPMAAGALALMVFSFVVTNLMAGSYSPAGAAHLVRALEKKIAGFQGR